MARIFSIDFEFRQNQYTALATSGTGADGNTRYTIIPGNEQLQRLLPNGKLSFCNFSELKTEANGQPAQDLVHSLATALQQKLNLQAVRQ